MDKNLSLYGGGWKSLPVHVTEQHTQPITYTGCLKNIAIFRGRMVFSKQENLIPSGLYFPLMLWTHLISYKLNMSPCDMNSDFH